MATKTVNVININGKPLRYINGKPIKELHTDTDIYILSSGDLRLTIKTNNNDSDTYVGYFPFGTEVVINTTVDDGNLSYISVDGNVLMRAGTKDWWHFSEWLVNGRSGTSFELSEDTTIEAIWSRRELGVYTIRYFINQVVGQITYSVTATILSDGPSLNDVSIEGFELDTITDSYAQWHKTDVFDWTSIYLNNKINFQKDGVGPIQEIGTTGITIDSGTQTTIEKYYVVYD